MGLHYKFVYMLLCRTPVLSKRGRFVSTLSRFLIDRTVFDFLHLHFVIILFVINKTKGVLKCDGYIEFRCIT